MCKFYDIYIHLVSFGSPTFVCCCCCFWFNHFQAFLCSAHPYVFFIWFSSRQRFYYLESKCSILICFPFSKHSNPVINYCENFYRSIPFILFLLLNDSQRLSLLYIKKNELNHKNGILPTFGRFPFYFRNFRATAFFRRYNSAVYWLG